MIKLEKKQVRIVSILIAVIFIGSVVALALTQTGNVASAASSSSVGVVDVQQVMAAHPDVQGLQGQMETTVNEIRKEFEEKSAGMNDQEKAEFYIQCQQRIAQKQEELLAPIEQSVEVAIKAVADKKGLAVVINKAAVVYGGQDITQDVIAQLSKK
ncbi:MAG: OmpH family outer membrane protein [Selenomonadaceae bacterium]|nr:OmpH family outer membrane protein [Selenomonadaceae bacterium]